MVSTTGCLHGVGAAAVAVVVVVVVTVSEKDVFTVSVYTRIKRTNNCLLFRKHAVSEVKIQKEPAFFDLQTCIFPRPCIFEHMFAIEVAFAWNVGVLFFLEQRLQPTFLWPLLY